MKTLLAFLYDELEFLYLNPRYTITDSSTDGNATVRITGPAVSFWLGNDRGQISYAVGRSCGQMSALEGASADRRFR
ncbi:hypothetical protein [Mycolicibacterium sediminis]|uniref:Uncharacterized protein n=1 Tax=Mycolicibacterium sediminis TaxID=1286180 RepID=A0A7I7QRT4_9MYCO|nr:hypothetical protein [Mycolicibacterium sediminis]BBY28667.1 hypothetical protein MSEDJ_27630 [Mycolicibacterium sediminis]